MYSARRRGMRTQFFLSFFEISSHPQEGKDCACGALLRAILRRRRLCGNRPRGSAHRNCWGARREARRLPALRSACRPSRVGVVRGRLRSMAGRASGRHRSERHRRRAASARSERPAQRRGFRPRAAIRKNGGAKRRFAKFSPWNDARIAAAIAILTTPGHRNSSRGPSRFFCVRPDARSPGCWRKGSDACGVKPIRPSASSFDFPRAPGRPLKIRLLLMQGREEFAPALDFGRRETPTLHEEFATRRAVAPTEVIPKTVVGHP